VKKCQQKVICENSIKMHISLQVMQYIARCWHSVMRSYNIFFICGVSVTVYRFYVSFV